MSRLPAGSSIRITLVAIIGVILVVGFATSSAISYQVSKSSLREALIANELPLTSDNIYSEIQRDLLRPVFVAQMMADDTFVRDWLLEGEVDSDRMIRFLREIRDKHGMFTSFLVSDSTRRYYHFSRVSQIVSEADPRDAWYFRVRDMADEHEINVDPNEEQGNALTIFINQKVFDYDGNYIAATGVGLAFETLANVVERYKENFSRHVYFVDSDGAVMARSDGATIVEDNIRNAAGVSNVADELLSSNDSSFEYARDGETMLVSARHIPELDWWVIIEQEEAAALASVRQSLITNFFVGLTAISLTLVIVLYAVNLFYARLEQKAVEMARLAEQEARLNKQLKYESETKDKFFSIISHDLISPFSSVLSGTEMMANHSEKESKEELTRLAGMVHQRAQSVFTLLRNLLDWARLQIEGGRLNPESIRLCDIVDHSIGLLTPAADEKGIRIENTVVNETVFADPNAVNAVMRNLISNAIKFTPSGGDVRVTAALRDGEVQVTVSDTGVGISKERLATIFDLDRVSSTSGTNREQGTGLGLILCKEMVELNGGAFWIDSTEGEGSHFHFTLPDQAG